MREITYAQAISEAISEEMSRDKDVVILGEDVGLLGGNFRATAGLYERFGQERVMDTPISEAGIIGCALGLAIRGMRPIAEIMFGDFLCSAMDQIVNQVAKAKYMSGGKISVPLVIRTNIGAGRSSAGQHSQSLQAWFLHTPGLKLVMPSSPYEVKGLLKSAVRDDSPVIVFEHRMLYNKKGDVPEQEYTIPLGTSEVKREGRDVTIVASSSMVGESLALAEDLAREGIGLEVIDLRSLFPMDKETIVRSVKKTGRLVLVDEGVTRGGITAEIAFVVMEKAFDYLDAPMERVGNENTPIPFSPVLERYVIPTREKIEKAVRKVINK
ncbi:MAG: alpha-ketoacid dehydrogenase subunit beta [Candidatus Omnitrophota bacterium]